MRKLEKIKKYAESLAQASQWKYSKEAIANINTIKKDERKKEYIYEFYCVMRIIDDLLIDYKIEVVNPNKIVVFPKAPSLKKNYPYFLVKNLKGEVLFQLCIGVKIMGHIDETNAPDISFQKKNSSVNPNYKDVFMIFDAKFKHRLNARVSDGEFSKICMMIDNLKCKNAEANSSKIFKFKKLIEFHGNCLISNGNAYKENSKLHSHHCIKEIEKFDEDLNYKMIC